MKLSKDYNLAVCNPKLAKEWHPTKNGSLTPKDVTAGSSQKAWWKCSNKKHPPWQAVIASRNSGRGCCRNCKSLQTVNPKLAREWHPTKNGSLTPKDVTVHSGKKVWWKCKKGHEWQARVSSRSNGRGCRYCHSSTSELELRIYAELKFIFKNVEHRKKIKGIECDVYLPELRCAIEIDGSYWHKNKHEKDRLKNKRLKDMDISLIRLRGNGLKKISNMDVLCSKKESHLDLAKKAMRRILKLTDSPKHIKTKIEQYIKRKEFANEKEFRQLLDRLPSPLPGLSLVEKNPKLAREWHPTKNGSLTPKDVTAGSSQKAWWKCSNKKHPPWQAVIGSRRNGVGCPYCAGKKVCKDNCLQTVNPKLAREWHPTKNGDLTPKDVTVHSGKKVWWKCKKGHEWQAIIASRNNGSGYRYCSNRFAWQDNCLETTSPQLAKEWHPTKNGNLTPKDVTAGSGQKAWWKCEKGHEWQAIIKDRNSGYGCCRNCKSLQILNPKLAKEWHPTKNGSLMPKDVMPYSHKKVWWKCKNGHEWEARIKDRNRGAGCRNCKSLQAINPQLAKEWHPTKNGSLTPKDVTPYSHKKVWWKCKKGHEWQARVSSRSNGRGCRKCYYESRKKSKKNQIELLNSQQLLLKAG